jgi:hypothetical protein
VQTVSSVLSDESIDDGRNVMEILWNREKVTRKVQRTLGRIIAAMKWTLLKIVFIGKDKAKRGKVKNSTRTRRRWQNILTNLPGVIGEARNATTPFEAWNCLITDEILGNIVQHTNQYILIIQPNCSRESDAKHRKIWDNKLLLVFCA